LFKLKVIHRGGGDSIYNEVPAPNLRWGEGKVGGKWVVEHTQAVDRKKKTCVVGGEGFFQGVRGFLGGGGEGKSRGPKRKAAIPVGGGNRKTKTGEMIPNKKNCQIEER